MCIRYSGKLLDNASKPRLCPKIAPRGPKQHMQLGGTQTSYQTKNGILRTHHQEGALYQLVLWTQRPQSRWGPPERHVKRRLYPIDS